jgi:hypothetical protein
MKLRKVVGVVFLTISMVYGLGRMAWEGIVKPPPQFDEEKDDLAKNIGVLRD